MSIVLALGWASPADAATWLLSGPNRARQGETATYMLKGSSAAAYRVQVYGGDRACPGRSLPSDPAETLSIEGYLDENGADILQISVSRGRSTICAYDEAATLMASKIVRTIPGRDRLRITAARQEDNPRDDAIVTVTGYVGRRGVSRDAAYRPTASEQRVGKVIVSAIPSGRDCPRVPPREYAPHTGSVDVSTARFSEEITLDSAFETSSELRLCGYLTAERQILGDIRTRTVASASTKISGDAASPPAYPDADSDLEAIFGGILAWIFIGSLIIGISAAIRFFLRDSEPVRATTTSVPHLRQQGEDASQRIPPPSPPGSPQPPTRPTVDVVAPEQPERHRHRAKPRDVVQDAADAVADTYRERLQTTLEHQDGADWLAKLNERRRASMTKEGKDAPRPYDSLEPRAVLSCLAYDPAGLQLISATAAKSAKQLSGLVNDAVHPKPQAPLTDDDGYRAWQLYTDITGRVLDGDPFER